MFFFCVFSILDVDVYLLCLQVDAFGFQILLMLQHHIVGWNSSIDFCIDVSCHILGVGGLKKEFNKIRLSSVFRFLVM